MNPPAVSGKPALELTVTLVDGRKAKYALSDADRAKSLVERIQPPRLFLPSLIQIGGDSAMDTFPTQLIVQIEIVSDLLPIYSHPMSVSKIVQVTEETFNERRTWADAVRPPVVGKDEIVVYQVLHLSTKETLYLEIHIDRPESGIPASAIRTTLDRPGFASLIFASHGHHADRTDGGGLIIVNPIHITQLTFLPGPAIIPAGAWHADPVT